MVAIKDYVLPECCGECRFVDDYLVPNKDNPGGMPGKKYYCNLDAGFAVIDDIKKRPDFCPLMECEDTPERPRSEEIALLKQGVKELARIREQLAWIKKEIGK